MFAVVTKKFWYAVGGFSNPRCYRKHTGRCWRYLMTCIVIMLLPLNALAMEHVMDFASLPGESMDAFAKRLTPEALRYTKRRRAEVCGQFERHGDTLRLALYTTGQHDACGYKASASRATGVSYHTHPAFMGSRPSKADWAHPGYMAHDGTLLHHTGTHDSVRRVP